MLKLIDMQCLKNLQSLNISSNQLSYVFFDELTKLFKNSNNRLKLKNLDLSNSKLTDKNGIELFEAVLNFT